MRQNQTDFLPAWRDGAPEDSLIASSRITHEMSQFPNPDLAGEKTPFRRNSNPNFECSLRPAWRSALFLFPLIAGSIWLSRVAILVALVTFQTETVSVPDIQKAVDLDPENADLLHRLGYVYSSSPTDSNMS